MVTDLSQFWFFSGMLAMLALAGTAVSKQTAVAQTGAAPPVPGSPSYPCHLLTSAQSIPQGFGAAYNLFSASKELLLDVECGASSNATLTVGDGQNTTYVYRFAYEWVNGGWKQIALAGSQLTGGDWYVGTARANLSRSQSQLAEDNFVVAYTCLRQNNSWKCGCRDTSCTQNYWQLQAFRQQQPSLNAQGAEWDRVGDRGQSVGITWSPSRHGNFQINGSGGADAYRFRSPASGNFDRLRFNLPRRTGYYAGDSGILRISFFEAGADQMPGKLLWRSKDYHKPAIGPEQFDRIIPGNAEYVSVPVGGGTGVPLERNKVYWILFENVGSGTTQNRFSLNHNVNGTRPAPPYSDAPIYDVFTSFRRTCGSCAWTRRDIAGPWFALRRASDEMWIGQGYMEGGSTSKVWTAEKPDYKAAQVEVSTQVKMRQRFKAQATYDAYAFVTRTWRTTSNTTDPLVVRLLREEAGGGTMLVREIRVPAQQFVWSASTPWAEGKKYENVRVNIPNTRIEKDRWYQLELSAGGSSTRYAVPWVKHLVANIPLPNDIPNGYGGGRAEYSKDGGKTWRGGFIYGSDENRNDMVVVAGFLTHPISP